jgi:hypothetical protein
MDHRDNFTLLGVRDYALAETERDLKPVLESGLGMLRGHDVPVLSAADRSFRHAGTAGILRRGEDAHRHQGQREVARAPARLSRLYRREAL